jgi:hypothetical protein
MKRAAVTILVSLALASEAFAVLRPRFPMKPEPPPFHGGAIIMNHDSDFVILEDDGIRQVIPGISSKYFVSSSEAGKTADYISCGFDGEFGGIDPGCNGNPMAALRCVAQ